MKNYKLKIKKPASWDRWRLAGIFILNFAFCIFNCLGQTAVLFPLAQMTGTTNDTTITVRPVNNPVNFNNQVYWLPPAGIQLKTVNGSTTTNLIPNDYTVTIAGVPGSWRISVSDTNVTLNAALIGNLTTYTFNAAPPFVQQLLAGPNITLSPTNGKGVVTVSSSGGGGGSATNAYQSQAGNSLITLATNTGTFVYTFSGVAQTNANMQLWGALSPTTYSNNFGLGSAAFVSTNQFDPAGAARLATNGYPWGTLYDATGAARGATNGYPWSVLYDSIGSATAATNGWPWGALYDLAGAAHSATNGYPWGTLYDSAGSAIAVTNGYPWGSLYDPAGAAHGATNGYPWSALYDAAGSATAATNGYPWGTLYDAAGAAQAATNGISLASGLAAFRGTNSFARTNPATALSLGLVKVDNSTITVASDGTISATTGGGGSVTSVGLSMPGEFSVTSSPVTGAGTLTVTRTADANFLGLGATNIGNIKITNTASIGGQAVMSALILTNGFTNQALTASTLLEADANKKVTSIPNAVGAITNDGAGNLGYVPLLDASALGANSHIKTGATTNLISSEDATGYTNTVSWTHDGTTTNITASFTGTLQSFTVTNGPTVFIGYAGANGSVSYRFTTNVSLVFTYQPKWLSGSNNAITNGVLSLTSYGGTNATQIEAAIGENQ
jgi:hypothetical protein